MISEIEELKKKRLQELQQQNQVNNEFQEHLKLQQQINLVEESAKQLMTREAVGRFVNLRAAHPEKALQAAAMIVQAAQTRQISQKITDEMLKELLMQITPQKKEFKIVRK